MGERELVILFQALVQGNREAFNKIFRLFYDPLVRFAVRYVGDSDIAEEIVQDFFVRLWSRHAALQVNSNYEAFLFRSVQNASLSYIETEKRHASINMQVARDDSDLNNPYEQLQGTTLDQAYRSIIDSMPEKRREVFLLSRFEGLKNAEVAHHLNISIKTVEAHLHEALVQLKNGLKDFM